MKTLKDLESNKDFFGDNILRNELQQEAIKWIREDISNASFSNESMLSILKWIRRFNINSDELIKELINYNEDKVGDVE